VHFAAGPALNHVGNGDIELKADPDADPAKLSRQQNRVHTRAVKAAESVQFWQTMPRFKVTKGLVSCNLWTLRKQLDGVVLSVPTALLVAAKN
jgi:hypothetical protein